MPLEFFSNSSLSYNQNSLATQEGLEKIILNLCFSSPKKSQIWKCFFPRSLLQSSALCTMGCALPLAIGAKLSDPKRRVICFVGDASLEMVLGELATLRDQGQDILVVVFVDRSLALIEKKQREMQAWKNLPLN